MRFGNISTIKKSIFTPLKFSSEKMLFLYVYTCPYKGKIQRHAKNNLFFHFIAQKAPRFREAFVISAYQSKQLFT